MSDTPEPVRIMLDGMDETPIAIPFPFKIGKYIIRDPDEWNWFRRHYAELEALTADRKKLLRRCKPWLENYLEYLDTDIPLLGEPNNTVANLIDELSKELGNE